MDLFKGLIKANAGPLAFLTIAGLMCLLLPQDKVVEAVYLIIGAALTRVKRTDNKDIK